MELGFGGLGSVFAAILSFKRNDDILLAFIHALFGWMYVIWYAFTEDAS
jgi:hypothetical protein